MADQRDRSGIILSPTTYERHGAAFDYVAQAIVTRDPRKGIGRFPGVAPGAWGLLAPGGAISGASGVTLGSGSVKLCDSSGVAYDPEASVPVGNAGGAISADDGARIVALEWTSGGWSTCGCGAGDPHLPCGPCDIPQKDLTVSWTNALIGDGIATLVYSPPGNWTSECTDGRVYSLLCVGGLIRFAVQYYTSGDADCSGQSQQCASTGSPPLRALIDCYRCDPFVLRIPITGVDCPFLTSDGFASFLVYDPDAPGVEDTDCLDCTACFRVVDCQGDPVEGAEFVIDDAYIEGSGLNSCTTDAAGECCLLLDQSVVGNGDSVPWTGEYTDPGGHLHELSGTLVARCITANVIAVEIPAVNEITFHVTSGCDDGPVEGAHVLLNGVDVGTTDASGNVVVEDRAGAPFVSVDADTDPPTDPYGANHALECAGDQTINIVLPCSAACTIRVHATGCNGLPVGGAEIFVDEAGVGNTDDDGEWESEPMDPGTYTVKVVCSQPDPPIQRFEDFEQEVVLADCPDIADVDAVLVVAPGYHCVACAGSMPMADSVTLTDFDYGSCTLDYSSGTWDGECTVYFPGDESCPDGNFLIRYSFNPADCTLAVSWMQVDGCPVDSGGDFEDAPTTAGDSLFDNFCSTFFSFDGSIDVLSPIYPSGGFYTITE